jgi:hypothetical protein
VAEEVVERALDQHADIEVVTGPAAERLDAKGGIGALLRFFTPESAALAPATA